jgi:predicted ATPase
MLQGFSLKNFSVFASADLQFSPGLNVIVGENGCGKSHILKAAYALMASSATEGSNPQSSVPTKSALQKTLADKLVKVLRPEALGRLVKRKQGRERCQLFLSFADAALNTKISFAPQSKSEVQIDVLPEKWVDTRPIFMPTRELLGSYHWMYSLYRTAHVDIEENLIDLCDLLGLPVLKKAPDAFSAELLESIETEMGGKVILDKNGRFYLEISGNGKLEMALLAEGWRKLAMLARLLSNGALVSGSTLFWDEPEANLNPRLIKLVARVLHELSRNGVQVIAATHSLFMLRELEILAAKDDVAAENRRFFALCQNQGDVGVEQGSSIDDLQTLVLLDEELEQSDRYMQSEV